MVKIMGWSTVITCVLVSCGDAEPAKDVAYYLNHPDERQQKRVLCQKQQEAKVAQYVKEGKKDISPTDVEPSANCKNAEEAQRKHNIDQANNSERIGLSGMKNDLDYFLEHEQERHQAIEQCERNALHLRGSKRCNNAQEAEKIKKSESKT